MGVVGGAVGGVIATVVFALVVVCIIRRKQKVKGLCTNIYIKCKSSTYIFYNFHTVHVPIYVPLNNKTQLTSRFAIVFYCLLTVGVTIS